MLGLVYGVERHFQQYFCYIGAVSFIGEEKRSTRRKSPVQSKATDKLYHIMLFRVEFELTTLVVIGNDCTSSYKSNCHTITATTNLHRNIRMSLRFN